MNKTLERRVLILITLAALAIAGAFVGKIYSSSNLGEAAAAASSKSLRDRAAAAPGQHFKGYLGFKPNTVYQNVDGLLQASSDVITGKVVRNHCEFGPNETSIKTNYVVSVSEVFKGTLKSGDKIVVTRPGGRVQLEDESYAEVEVLFAGKHMMNNRSYVLFLTKVGDDYTSVGGPQGIFRVLGNNIEPADPWKAHPVVSLYSDMNTNVFLGQIRQGAKGE